MDISDEKDYSCLDLALYLNNCQAHYYYSDQYEKLYPQEKDRWWLDKNELIVGGQKIHLITYLGACYTLQGSRKNSVHHLWTDNGFKNAAGLIWLLEALGADEQMIIRAFEAGEKEAKNGAAQPAQSKAVKAVIKWEQVCELLDKKEIIQLQKRGKHNVKKSH